MEPMQQQQLDQQQLDQQQHHQPSPYELENNFEPQTRARSNTWPCPPPSDGFVDVPGKDGSPPQQVGPAGGTLIGLKKNTSRRNAWGNLSYADLITSAISSSPDKRLTLSQIYDWMVQNVPYFKDKGDSNSSAGWKVSFRKSLNFNCLAITRHASSGLLT